MKHTRTTTVVSIAAGLLVLPAAVASAATTTLYVNKTVSCSDKFSGTSPTAPLCTIAAANSRATAGTTVNVVAGTYKEMVAVKNSGTSSARITFHAGSGVTITGLANGFVVNSKNYITITGFKVTATTGVGILANNSSHLVIDHNDVSSAGKPVSGHTAQGISLVHTTASTISGNTRTTTPTPASVWPTARRAADHREQVVRQRSRLRPRRCRDRPAQQRRQPVQREHALTTTRTPA